MTLLGEYRNPELAAKLISKINEICTRSWKIMEVCGGQTHSIIEYGIDKLISSQIELLHGPGCPVCVTPIEIIDQIIELSNNPDHIICTFADMLRVPGTHQDLDHARSAGALVMDLYSPIQALEIAEKNPNKQIILFAIGFETTAPSHAVTLLEANRKGLKNISFLVSHVLVPPAIEFLLLQPNQRIDGFLAAGHVCAIQGLREYHPLVKKYQKPIVVTGFEPLDLLQGIYFCVRQLENGQAQLTNQYQRVIRPEGNMEAQRIVTEVFELSDQIWRGIGPIPGSGLRLRDNWKSFDASLRFNLALPIERNLGPNSSSLTSLGHDTICRSGLIMQGLMKPFECPQFGKTCTPLTPLGATMVSGEGACAAYYRHRREEKIC